MNDMHESTANDGASIRDILERLDHIATLKQSAVANLSAIQQSHVGLRVELIAPLDDVGELPESPSCFAGYSDESCPEVETLRALGGQDKDVKKSVVDRIDLSVKMTNLSVCPLGAVSADFVCDSKLDREFLSDLLGALDRFSRHLVSSRVRALELPTPDVSDRTLEDAVGASSSRNAPTAPSITPERARSTFRHPENADLARPAIAAVDALARVDDETLEVCS